MFLLYTNNNWGIDGTCYDKIKNGNETGIDTGGKCGTWTNLDGTCYDKIKNGNETSVDLGGRCGSGLVLTVIVTTVSRMEMKQILIKVDDGSGFGLDGNCYDKIKMGMKQAWTSVDDGKFYSL